MEPDQPNILFKLFMQVYHYTCIALSLALVIFVLYTYLQNTDISRVEYVKFQSTDQRFYPSFSLCFGDILLSRKLVNYGVNESHYLKFLRGKVWEPRLMDINYHDVSINLEDYLLGIEMYEENFNGEIVSDNNYLYDKTNTSSSQWKPNFYQDSSPAFGLIQKCLTVDIPYQLDKRLSWITAVMNRTIFTNGTRPFNTREATDMFSVNIHHPGQRYRYSKAKRDWNAEEPSQQPNDQPTSYGMKFYIFSMEVMKKRNKRQQRCNDNMDEKDDQVIKTEMMKNFSCTPPYWTTPESGKLSNCSSQKQLQNFHEMSIKSSLVPCRRMTQVTYLYSEYASDYYYKKLQNLPADSQNIFVTFMYPDSRYKEIVMLRELNILSLIGNAGGYVGICVGYSILQFPNIITAIYTKIKSISMLSKKSSSFETKVSVFTVDK